MLRKKGLGTAVLVGNDKDTKGDSDAESDWAVTAPLASGPPRPWFPPPPTAPAREKKRVRIREPPKPVEELPQLPILPTHIATLPPPAPVELPPRRKPVRGKSVRKTLLAHIDGWWDLGLLDKRKTLLAPPETSRA